MYKFNVACISYEYNSVVIVITFGRVFVINSESRTVARLGFYTRTVQRTANNFQLLSTRKLARPNHYC